MRKCLLPMYLFTVFTVTAQQTSPLTNRVTVLLSDITLEKALTIISISYGVQFYYSDDVVPTETMVNLEIHDQILTDALHKLLNPYGITYKIMHGDRVVLRKIPFPFTQTIRGNVLDDVTNTPVPGATVVVNGTDPLVGTTTGNDGTFVIDNVVVGRKSITVSSVGYDTRTLNGILLGTGKEVFLNVRLTESVTAMHEVVVTAIKNDGIPGDGAAVTSAKTYSVEETRRYAGSMGDPARMASAFAGVTSGNDENNALVVRGNSPRGILWRIEGIEIPNPNHFASEGSSSGIVSVLSANVVERSDLLTGAFPAPYGNALSAVLDIHLRNGNHERKEYSFQAGLLGMEASIEGPLHKTFPASYLVNYRYSTLSLVDKLGVNLNEAGQYKDYQDLSVNLNWRTRGGTVSVFGIGGTSKANRTDTTLMDNNASDMGVVGLIYKHNLNSNTSLNSTLCFSGTRISKYSEVWGLDGGPLALQERYSKSYARASFTMRKRITNRYYAEAGTTLSRLDYNFFLRNVDPGNPAYQVILNFKEEDHDYTTTGQVFLHARQYFSPKLFAFYGFHFLYFALTKDKSMEPRLGMRWMAAPEKSISIGYGKHSRIENLQYYLARDHQPGGNEVQINKNLGFTRAHHFVLSYEQAFPAHRLKLETYYQQLYNAPVHHDPNTMYASINEDAGFITDTLVNKGNGRNYGIEASLERSFFNDMYFMINGSLFQSTFTLPGNPERSTPYNGNYSIHLLTGREFSQDSGQTRFGVNLRVTFAGGRPYVPIDLEKSIQEGRQVYQWEAAYENRLPVYFRTDLQLVYRVNKTNYAVEWRFDIQNLTHHRNAAYYHYDPATESIRLRRQVGFVPVLSCKVEF